MKIAAFFASVAALAIPAAFAQVVIEPPTVPIVAVTGAANASVANDRMRATMRVEAEQPQPAAAANEVNTKMAQALARAKAVAGVDARTAGYSTWQVSEKGKPVRWHAVQSLVLEGGDFAAIAALVTRLQEDGLLMSGMTFSVSPEMRRRVEDGLTERAIREWQARATLAAQSLGYAGWRPGRLSVNTGESGPRVEPMYRASVAAAAPAPVAVEGGTTEIAVTVTGEAVLEKTSVR